MSVKNKKDKTINKSVIADDLNFQFVFKSEDDFNISSLLQTTFETGRNYFPKEQTPKWISGEECLKLKKKDLNKRFVFIMEEFSGPAFEFLSSTSALILGPRCFLSCLLDGTPIPLGSSPVFTPAMNNLVVAASGLSVSEKQRIEKLVRWMGGFFSPCFSLACTHLVSITVRSEKYEIAAKQDGVKIMRPSWVDDVWKVSQEKNVNAGDPIFDCHSIPIFYKLNVTSTGLTGEIKARVSAAINSNGGVYHGQFRSEVIDILVLQDNGINSQKYQIAVKFGKDCVTPDWVFDSVEKKYSVGMNGYRLNVVSGKKCSTPVKSLDDQFTLNCSNISQIMAMNQTNCTLNETSSSNSSTVSRKTRSKSVMTTESDQNLKYKETFGQLSVTAAKKSGAFLDGCSIYLSSFTKVEKEVLNKIISNATGVRCDELDERITHFIIGNAPDSDEIKFIKANQKKLAVVSLDWLKESIERKHPANDSKFRFDLAAQNENSIEITDAPSPSTKKNIDSMSGVFKKPKIPKFDISGAMTSGVANKKSSIVETVKETTKSPPPAPCLPPSTVQPPQHQEDDILEKYLNPEPSDNENRNDICDSVEPTCSDKYFTNHRLCFFGFDSIDTAKFRETAEDYGAVVLADLNESTTDGSQQPIDFLVVPVVLDDESIFEMAKDANVKEVVNDLWAEDVANEKKVVKIKYHHRPIIIPEDCDVLKENVIVTSIYTGTERLFLVEISRALGSRVDEIYNRNLNPILVCSAPKGAKYEASVKWKLPAVSHEWLLECVKKLKLIDFGYYSVNPEMLQVSHIIPSTQPDDSVAKSLTSLKRKSEENDENHTPKRNQLAGPSNRHGMPSELNKHLRTKLHEVGTDGKSSWPPSPTDDMSPASRRVAHLETPTRKVLYKFWKEKEAEENDPQKQLERLLKTPGRENDEEPYELPEYLRTPSPSFGLREDASPLSKITLLRKFRTISSLSRANWSPASPIKPPTPFSEVKRRFWKDALGDAYYELSTQDFTNFGPTASTKSNDQVPATQATNTQGMETENQPSTSASTQAAMEVEHVQQLHQFLKNRPSLPVEDRPSYENEIEVDSIPLNLKTHSENIGTEIDVIDWNDPADFNSRRRATISKERMLYKSTPKFLLISFATPEVKVIISDGIKKLKGIKLDDSTFDINCTHVISEQASRSEKMLSSIASGKWILSPSYILDSLEAGFFVNENLHEWGNPDAIDLQKLKPADQVVANAAHRWRKKISSGTGKESGAFTGFRVILHVLKKEQFQTVIRAGGGYVIDVQPPYIQSDEAMTATHCFVEMKKLKLSDSDFKSLTEAGCRVLSLMYINDMLMSVDYPDLSKYQITCNSSV